MMRTFVLFLTIMCMAGCEVFGPADAADVVESEAVHVQVEDDGLMVTNRSGQAVYYFALGETIAPLIFWAPTLNNDYRVEGYQSKHVPFTDINMDQERETHLLFNWWRANADASGADSVRVFSVAL